MLTPSFAKGSQCASLNVDVQQQLTIQPDTSQSRQSRSHTLGKAAKSVVSSPYLNCIESLLRKYPRRSSSPRCRNFSTRAAECRERRENGREREIRTDNLRTGHGRQNHRSYRKCEPRYERTSVIICGDDSVNAEGCMQTDSEQQIHREEQTILKSRGETRAMVQDLALGDRVL